MARSFKAKYNGYCCAGTNCKNGGRILVGQFITWNRAVKGRVRHVDCSDTVTPYEKEQAPSREIDDTTAPTPAPETAPTDDMPKAPPIPTDDPSDSSEIKTEIMEALDRLASSGKTDPEEVKRIVGEAIEPIAERADRALKEVSDLREKTNGETAPTRVEIVTADAPEVPKDLGIQHCQFPLLLKVLSARQAGGKRLNIWLTGPAGSGKTTAAEKAAEALGLKFYFTGAIDTPYPLLGFMNAHGEYVRTPFRDWCENGGVFLFDEYDGSHPTATLPFNATLGNGYCAFPDKIVKLHPDCIALAAANTWGLGGTSEYVGRNRLDAASLDRFVALDWKTDEALETVTAGNAEWAKRVQAVRAAVKRENIKVLITPRASYFGAALLAAGMDQSEVEALTLRKGLSNEQWRRVG